MKLISDPEKDVVTPSKKPGGYEWWYFDAVDERSGYSFVVIFYHGSPFSNRYIKQLEKEPNASESNPGKFPAISISVYKNNKPIYYSFSEFKEEMVEFRTDVPFVKIGSHHFRLGASQEKLTYELELQEELASGDQIKAVLTFSSSYNLPEITDSQAGVKAGEGHIWNLVQPRAKVSGIIQLFQDSERRHDIKFDGEGYHDHNTGQEPMKNEFEDWYWGRFHFPAGTLVYYAMNRQNGQQQQRAWLIEGKHSSIVEYFDNITFEDRSLSLFGLYSSRKLFLDSQTANIVIQQTELLDNGPFYQRFSSDAFLSIADQGVQKAQGITEYIYPARIYRKLFWPFVDMRIRYQGEKPHWVQKSGKLYRWTW